MRLISFYKTVSGKCPVEEHLDSLSDTQVTKITWVLKFAQNCDKGYEQFKIGALLKQARLDAGLTQAQAANKLKTGKSTISRIENHAEDIQLSSA